MNIRGRSWLESRLAKLRPVNHQRGNYLTHTHTHNFSFISKEFESELLSYNHRNCCSLFQLQRLHASHCSIHLSQFLSIDHRPSGRPARAFLYATRASLGAAVTTQLGQLTKSPTRGEVDLSISSSSSRIGRTTVSVCILHKRQDQWNSIEWPVVARE